MPSYKNETRRNRLIKMLKIHRIFLAALLLGVVLLWVASMPRVQHYVALAEWLKLFGQTLIIAGIVTGTYEFIVREETQKQIMEGTQISLNKLKADIDAGVRGSVVAHIAEALLLDKNVQKQILARGKVNEVLLTCLSTKLGEEMSQELLSGVIEPVLDAFGPTKQRIMQDYDLRVQLEESGTPSIATSFYLLYLTIEYKYVLKVPQLRFACVTSRKEFQTFLDDPTLTYVYLLPNSALTEIQFDVVVKEFQCEGRDFTLQIEERTPKKGLKEISFGSFELPQCVGKECKLSYRISTLIRKDGHLFFVRIKHPIKNLRASFDSGNTAITNVSVSDQFVSSGGIMLHEETVAGKIIKAVSVDGWVFPNSGVTFVWHYE